MELVLITLAVINQIKMVQITIPQAIARLKKNSIGNRFKEIYLYLSNIDIECEKPLHTLQTVVETDRKHIMESIKL